MHPFRSFLILLLFLVCLTGVFNIYPVRDYFSKPETVSDTSSSGISQVPDTAQPGIPAEAHDSINVQADSSSADLLSSFRHSLTLPGRQVRIMYYGDSQLEGDRITFYLRQLLRQHNGGSGPGLFLPVMPVMYTKSLWLRASPNWERYNYLSYSDGEISHNRLGPFMTFCRYLPEGTTRQDPERAYVRIQPSAFSDSAAASWENLRILYSHEEGIVNLRIGSTGKLILADTLPTGKGVQNLICDVRGSDDLLIEFEGRVSPDIYGISLESPAGLIVDNIPQRGSAGLEFTMVDRDNLEESYRILSPDLFVLHYGLNIVRSEGSDFSFYRTGLIRQVRLLKEIAPNTPVLIVGVSDMVHREGDSLVSFTSIPAIVEAQSSAASESGAAFWDARSAMGGSRSIVDWAKKSPALAQDDYVHLTYQGADTLSVLLYNALFYSFPDDSAGRFISGIDNETAAAPPVADAGRSSDVRPMLHQRLLKILPGILSYDDASPFIFTLPGFWLFLLGVLAGYLIVWKKYLLRNSYLLAVSLFFYFKTGGLFVIILVLITIIDFACGWLIHNSKAKASKRFFLLLSLISNLGILAYFKYTGFIVETINNLAGTQYVVYDYLASFSNYALGTSFDISNILLPAGISFFTFQSLSYTFDIYRGKLDPVTNILDFGFYVSFFPQLVAGPIVRASEFIPQLYSKYNVTKREFSHALFMISKGLIKKIVISDFLAVNFVDRVFEMPAIFSGFENLLAVYGYGLQIYCDFSGYTDIAIGIALILGFRLPLNFNSPYKASDVADFWRRWHISLSRWLKDYLYISLGGNRKGKIRTGINLMVTMLLGGLWHGAAIRFIIWGGLHGTGLIISKIWTSAMGRRIPSSRIRKITGIFLTFNFVSFCWIFFRAPDMDSAWMMLRQIGENFSPGSWMAFLTAYSSVVLIMGAGYIIHFLPEKIKESYRGLFIRMPLMIQMLIIALVAVLLLVMRSADVMPFIYFRF